MDSYKLDFSGAAGTAGGILVGVIALLAWAAVSLVALVFTFEGLVVVLLAAILVVLISRSG